MKRIWIVFIFCCNTIGLTAQNITLPVLEPYSDMFCKIEAEWKPSKEFLAANPDFLKDGSYNIDMTKFKEDLSVNDYGRMEWKGYNKFKKFKNFNSNNYPVKVIENSSKPNLTGRAIVILTTDSHSLFPLVRNNTPIPPRQIYTTWMQEHDAGVEYMVNLGIRRKAFPPLENSSKIIFKEKGMDIAGVPYLHYPSANFELMGIYVKPPFITTSDLQVDDVIFEFAHVFTHIGKNNDQSAFIPSCVFLKLNVRSAIGEIIKTYNQCVFVNVKVKANTVGYNDEAKVSSFRQSLPHLMKSLVNQFTSDNATQQLLKEKIAELKTAEASGLSNIKTFQLQQRLFEAESEKEHIVLQLNKINKFITEQGLEPVDVPSNPNAQSIVMYVPHSPYTSAATQQAMQQAAQGIQQGAAALGEAIAGKMLIEDAKKKKVVGEKLIERYSELNKIEEPLLAELEKLGNTATGGIVNKSLDAKVGQYQLEIDEKLKKAINALKASNSKNLQQFSAELNNINNAVVQGVSANLSSKNKGKGGAVVEAATAQDCMEQVKSDFANTPEGRALNGGLTKLMQYEVYEANAKLCDLFLQQCGGFIPANERQLVIQTRDDALRIAQECRRGAKPGPNYGR